MSVLKILQYPDPRLRLVAQPIKVITKEIHKLAHDMLETMYVKEGIGLAATQVNVQLQIIVISKNNFKKDHLILINPKIIKKKEVLVWKKDVYLSQNTVLLYHAQIIFK